MYAKLEAAVSLVKPRVQMYFIPLVQLVEMQTTTQQNCTFIQMQILQIWNHTFKWTKLKHKDHVVKIKEQLIQYPATYLHFCERFKERSIWKQKEIFIFNEKQILKWPVTLQSSQECIQTFVL